MLAGAAQIDITPAVGVDLSGFAARVQPSTGVLDPLFTKALYVVEGDSRLLWLHADVISVERELTQRLRRWAYQRFSLATHQVMVSATHTHSGPVTVKLQEAGEYDPDFVEQLEKAMQQAAEAAIAQASPCEMTAVEGTSDLAVDRRGKASAHTDVQVCAVGFRRDDGRYLAVLMNYPIHSVALGPTNRSISADLHGQMASCLSQQLLGEPVVLATNGACGNLNPPAENVPLTQVAEWGARIAAGVLTSLRTAPAIAPPRVATASMIVALPADALTPDEIAAHAAKVLTYAGPLSEWGDKFRRATTHWQDTMTAAVRRGDELQNHEVELLAVALGPLVFVGVNAEMFSTFTDLLRKAVSTQVYTVGYANGNIGYIPARAAYDEGGYEVEVAHLFYGGFRPKCGGLELLAQQGASLARELMRNA